MEHTASFEEKLLDLVQMCPVLYDVDNPSYRRNNIRQQVWTTIAKKLGSTAKKCQLKWKNIRYAYFRSKRNGRLLSGNVLKKRKYSRDLSFLEPYYNNNTKQIKDNDDMLDNFETVDTNYSEGEDDCSSQIEEERSSTPVPSMFVEVSEPQNLKLNSNEVLQKLENAVTTLSADKRIIDSIEHYCLSLVDPLRAMDRSEQERVKFEFSKILKDARYEN